MFAMIERAIIDGYINECNIRENDEMTEIWQLGNPTDSFGFQPAASVRVIATIGSVDYAIAQSAGNLILCMGAHGQHYSTDARRLSNAATDIVRSWNLF